MPELGFKTIWKCRSSDINSAYQLENHCQWIARKDI